MNYFYFEKLLSEENEQVEELKNINEFLNLENIFESKNMKKYKLKDVLSKQELKSNLKKISQDFFSKEEKIKTIPGGGKLL
ncbi:hypothetical protein N5T98_02545 [Aliarcobacter cryaerophilus]|uniref:hypothetical protein n=1 Tax=Aliarcobacter cryaerophilus TaxID=28198 RepID=UPI0021B4FE63|nr:hypothetical protein [Aliarcobacter cryaerophilus]MCT7485872.1 hypothetical protein [Aliarcobacter cryaerophilus]MCT7489970.1 hypothetical protein [Aliarcobacter cryaerophilus]